MTPLEELTCGVSGGIVFPKLSLNGNATVAPMAEAMFLRFSVLLQDVIGCTPVRVVCESLESDVVSE